MSQAEKPITAQASIDTQGQSAAWSILCAERAVEQLKPGQVLEVSISDPQLAIDLPRILRQRGNLIMATRRQGPVMRLYVRRGASQDEQPINSQSI